MPAPLIVEGPIEDQPKRNKKKKARQAMRTFDAALNDLTDGWSGLNANQQRDAMRNMIIILARLQAAQD